jgi:hypothetical protein
MLNSKATWTNYLCRIPRVTARQERSWQWNHTALNQQRRPKIPTGFSQGNMVALRMKSNPSVLQFPGAHPWQVPGDDGDCPMHSHVSALKESPWEKPCRKVPWWCSTEQHANPGGATHGFISKFHWHSIAASIGRLPLKLTSNVDILGFFK